MRTATHIVTVLGLVAGFVSSVSADITFGPPTLYELPGWGEGHAVAFGDYDQDGDLDMVVASTYNPIDGRITVFANDGSGAFGDPVYYPTGGSNPTGLVALDVNGDSWLDLAYTLFSPGSSVHILLNDQSGGFIATQSLHSGNATRLATGDLNGDGWPDLVSCNSQVSGSTAKVFLNNGAGFLLGGVEYLVAGSVRSVTVADLDGDKDLDLITASLYADVVTILWNTGDGTFAGVQNEQVGHGAWFIAAADLDDDGALDLAVSSTGSSGTSDVSILFNNGDSTFQPQVTYDVGYNAKGIVAEDLDNDGDVDIAVVVEPQARVFILANHGDGTFAEPTTFPCGLPGDGSYTLTAGDVDADGRVDLAVTNTGLNQGVTLLLNQTPAVAVPGDIDGDGVVGITDLLLLLVAWGPCPGCPADLDGSGAVDFNDLLELLVAWGPC